MALKKYYMFIPYRYLIQWEDLNLSVKAQIVNNQIVKVEIQK